jgi:mRNA interferase RelE/StbE
MVRYEHAVRKQVEKRAIPLQVMKTIHNALNALDQTRDLQLFDVKEMRGPFRRTYYRLRKGKYRAIFFFEDDGIAVVYVGKREEVYRLWE